MDKIYLNFLHEIDTLWDKECAIYNEVGVESGLKGSST